MKQTRLGLAARCSRVQTRPGWEVVHGMVLSCMYHHNLDAKETGLIAMLIAMLVAMLLAMLREKLA